MLRGALLFLCAVIVTALLVFVGLARWNAGAADAGEPVVQISAHKFVYAPNEVHLKLGEPVILEIASTDVDHGFNIPALNLRADLLPGQVARVRLIPQKAGRFEFYCDNFCGLDHENMNGTIVVE
jgi:cytochrome c oxidase subunit II